MASIQRTISIASLTSITSEESLTGKKKKMNNNSVTVGFKFHWFETTLSFIKDDRRLSLNYGVTAAQAAFIRDMLNFEEDPTLKQEKYAPLYEALTIFGLKYSFKLRRLNKDVIVLQKIPKVSRQMQEPDSTSATGHHNPKISKEKQIVECLSQKYMIDMAETILDFIEDPTRVTLEFADVKPLESMFMQHVLHASRPLFPQHTQMLQQIKALKTAMGYNLKVVVGKIRRTNDRIVTFKKVPKFSGNSRRSRDPTNLPIKAFVASSNDQPDGLTRNNITDTQNVMTENNSMEQSMLRNENGPPVNMQYPINNANEVKLSREWYPNEIMEVDSPRNDSVSSSNKMVEEPRLGAQTAVLSYERATSINKPLGNANFGSQKCLKSAVPARSVIPVRRLDERRTKLMEAMSMPVQLDKPARMMQKMGWDGGPLGCRGVGITEPIMPALDLVSGAGFGHVVKQKPREVPPPRPEVTEKQSFRLQLLTAILDLLRAERDTIELVYHNALNKKEVCFVRHAIRTLSDRQKMSLHATAEEEVSRRVVAMLREMTTTVINGAVSGCKRKVLLKRITYGTPDKSQIELPPRRGDVITVEHLSQLADTIEVYREKTKKKKKVFGARIAVLVDLLAFVKSKDLARLLTFELPLHKTVKAFITHVVESINLRTRPSQCVLTLEENYCDSILGAIGGYMLLVDIDKRKLNVVFEKRLPPERKSYNVSVLNALRSVNVNVDKVNTAQNSVNENVNNGCETAHLSKNCDIVSNNIDTGKTSTYINVSGKNNNATQISGQSFNGSNSHVEGRVSNKSQTNIVQNTNNNIIKNGNSENAVKSNGVTNVANAKTVGDSKNKLSNAKPNVVVNTGINIKNKCNSEEAKTNANNSNVQNEFIVNGHNGYSKDIQSDDDDVVIVETKQEIITISDDELDAYKEGAQNNTNNVKPGMNEDRVNVEIKTDKTEDLGIDKSSAEMSECKTNDNVEGNVEKNESTFETSAGASESLTFKNVEVNSEINETRIETNADVSETQEIAEYHILLSVTKELDSSESETNIDVAKCDETKNVKEIQQNVELSETDIDKDVDILAKIEPKVERDSYTEFDRDLEDLEKILNLDDDVFDYTVVKKEAADKMERPMSKRSRSDSECSSPDNTKKTKVFIFKSSQNVLIVPKEYPNELMKNDCMKKIQTVMSDAIEKCKELPLLKCHGIQDGGLLYSCHNEQSLFFIEDCLSVASDYKIISDVKLKEKSHNMKIRFNSLLDDTKKLFNRLELYNAGLITDNWCVKDVKLHEDYTVISLKLDDYSYKYICVNRFALYAGIDEIRFTVDWD